MTDLDYTDQLFEYTLIPDIEISQPTEETNKAISEPPIVIQSELNRLKSQLNKSQQTANKMTYDYLKELQLLREMVYQKEKLGDGFEYMDVYFFSPNEELDEKTCVLLNAKVQELANQFNHKLVLLQKTNTTLKKTIANFEKVNEGTPGLFAYHEVSSEGIISKLVLIESDARKIWKALETCYGHSFFLDVIKENFGLIPTVNSKFEREFNEKLLQYQKEATEQITKLMDRYNEESKDLKNDLRQKEEHIEELCQKHTKEMEQLKNEIEGGLKRKIQDKENALRIIFASEKDILLRKMKEQETLIYELSSNKTLSRLRLRLAVIFKFYLLDKEVGVFDDT